MSEDVSAWDEPAGIPARGTVVVLAGRGESAQLYQRFGTRLAADAYRVRVLGDVTQDLPSARSQIANLLADATLPEPKVLVGTDTGALLALRLGVHAELGIDGIIVAGLPAGGGRTPAGWDDELQARTACPAHRLALVREDVDKHALDTPIPATLQHIEPQNVVVPVLAVHGRDDAIAPVEEALRIHRALPQVEIVVIDGGRHDALNDVTHRTVAATIVLFLERLKLGADLPTIAHRVG